MWSWDKVYRSIKSPTSAHSWYLLWSFVKICLIKLVLHAYVWRKNVVNMVVCPNLAFHVCFQPQPVLPWTNTTACQAGRCAGGPRSDRAQIPSPKFKLAGEIDPASFPSHELGRNRSTCLFESEWLNFSHIISNIWTYRIFKHQLEVLNIANYKTTCTYED
jgi:hypothetical protein